MAWKKSALNIGDLETVEDETTRIVILKPNTRAVKQVNKFTVKGTDSISAGSQKQI